MEHWLSVARHRSKERPEYNILLEVFRACSPEERKKLAYTKKELEAYQTAKGGTSVSVA